MPETGSETKSLPTLAAELWELVRAYALQETVEPIKGIGRYVIFGAIGSVFVGTGIVLLVLGFLRILQDETGSTFHGNWSWAPYLITMAVCAVVVVAALSKTRARKRAS